jgi:transposase-like protein
MTSTTIQAPTTLLQAVSYFSDQERAFDFVKDIRWPDDRVACPWCGQVEPSFLATRRIWKCKGCKRQFSLKVGTIFEDSPLGWDKWVPAVWLLANSKNSVSSHELGRALGVTQKTAWFMLHRIRDAMATGSFARVSGIVEVDETYVGGLGKFMHKDARSKLTGTGGTDKAIVQGARHREAGQVRATVVEATDAATLQGTVRSWVEPGSAVFTDQHVSYRGLEVDYAHKTVDHSREYVSGIVHTNGIENFWSLLKRALKGTQTHVDRVHLDRYVTERTFAYNHRDDSDLTRLRAAIAGAGGRRLTWARLTDHG